MNNRKNLMSALVYQIAHIAYGLIIPRLVIGAFGSEVNGLVSSITQFLSFISLLEGGLGAVVLAELYRPIEEKDSDKIQGILLSCQKFFSKLAIIFVIYTIIVAIVYSVSVRNSYEPGYTVLLVFILSLTTLAQYLFAITSKLYLQASQRIYLINYLSAATLVFNIIIAVIVIKVYPEIHLLKFSSSVAFFVQPILYNYFIERKYKRPLLQKAIPVTLKNRWSGFAQNLAHFINMNTDIVLITLFSTFGNVSVYSVYLLSINALRSVISNVTNSYQSALGKYFVEDNPKALNERFDRFCRGTGGVSLILFCTCLLLINPFVLLYTTGIGDANYYQPAFGLIIVIANLIYCIREPYRLLILAAGKFKETNFGSVMEAVLNIVVSIALIKKFGLLGVAIGTLVAISFRMVYFVLFLKKEILVRRLRAYLIPCLKSILIVGLNIVVYLAIRFTISNYFQFCLYGFGIVVAETIVVCLIYIGPYETRRLVKRVFFRR